MKKLTLALAVTAAFASGSAHALLVDGFGDVSQISHNGTTQSTTAGTNPQPVTNPTNTSLFNNNRTFTLSAVTGASALSPSKITSTGSGTLSISNDPGVDSTATVDYVFDSTDFTASATAIAMAVTFIDTNVSVLMSLATATGTMTMAAAQVFSGVGNFYAPYNLFSVGSGDLTQVTGLTMVFNGPAGWDAQVQLLETTTPPTGVPEIDAISGTGALTLMAGALALAGERRRRRS